MNDTMTLAEVRQALANEVAANSQGTTCPCCEHRVRRDTKSLSRWMAHALDALYEHDKTHPNVPVRAADLVKGTPGDRDHCVALLRHWRLISEVERPDGEAGGSRGVSGWYVLTEWGRKFREGRIRIPKNIVRGWNEKEHHLDLSSPMISFQDALKSKQRTNADGNVLDGTTVNG